MNKFGLSLAKYYTAPSSSFFKVYKVYKKKAFSQEV
jgi:hypothetical protein